MEKMKKYYVQCCYRIIQKRYGIKKDIDYF